LKSVPNIVSGTDENLYREPVPQKHDEFHISKQDQKWMIFCIRDDDHQKVSGHRYLLRAGWLKIAGA